MTHADGGKRYWVSEVFEETAEQKADQHGRIPVVLASDYAALQQQLEQAQGVVNENGSFKPIVYEQVLIQGRCGVAGHFQFQENGSNCILCQDVQRVVNRAEQAEARVRELDLALQSLTPGGSEYVNAPQTCVAYVQRIKTDCVEAHKENVRMRREFEAALATATARVSKLEGLLQRCLVEFDGDEMDKVRGGLLATIQHALAEPEKEE